MALDKAQSDTIPANALFFEGVTRFSESTWTPNTDVFLEEDGLVIQVEVAGLRLSDVKVRVEENRIVFSGKRSIRKQNSRRKFILMEISSDSFQFYIELPKVYNVHHAKSEYVNGILRIDIPVASRSSNDISIAT